MSRKSVASIKVVSIHVVSIHGVSIQTQAVKSHKNFVHFKYSSRVNKKNMLGEYLRSLSQVMCNDLHLE